MVLNTGFADTSASGRSSDETLLGDVVSKDEVAFERLYKRYYQRVFQFVSRMVRDRRTAEEVVDDTMFAVWKSAGKFEGRANVSTWIFGIAYRRALKTLDSNKRHSRLESDDNAIAYKADEHPEADPEAVMATADLRRQIDNGIEHLSSDHRAVMLLTLMGHNYDEIAKVVDCPASTVKTRMFYARKNLKRILSEPVVFALMDETRKDTWSHRTQIS